MIPLAYLLQFERNEILRIKRRKEEREGRKSNQGKNFKIEKFRMEEIFEEGRKFGR